MDDGSISLVTLIISFYQKLVCNWYAFVCTGYAVSEL